MCVLHQHLRKTEVHWRLIVWVGMWQNIFFAM